MADTTSSATDVGPVSKTPSSYKKQNKRSELKGLLNGEFSTKTVTEDFINSTLKGQEGPLFQLMMEVNDPCDHSSKNTEFPYAEKQFIYNIRNAKLYFDRAGKPKFFTIKNECPQAHADRLIFDGKGNNLALIKLDSEQFPDTYKIIIDRKGIIIGRCIDIGQSEDTSSMILKVMDSDYKIIGAYSYKNVTVLTNKAGRIVAFLPKDPKIKN